MVSEIFFAGALLAGSPEVLVRATENGASPETVSALVERALAGLTSAGVVATVGDPWDDGCRDDACTREAMTETSAAAVVVLSVEQRDNVYRFELDARSGTTGRRLGRAQDVCEICGLDEVAELVEMRAASLATKLDVPHEGTIRVASEPSGSAVYVGEERLGVTPVDIVLPEGTHAVLVEKPGFIPDTKTVDVLAGVEGDLRFRLMPEPMDADVRDAVARRWFVAGGVAVGVGVLGVAAGIPLVLFDAKPYRANCRADIQGNCAQLYDTMGAGASLTTAGVIGLGAGAAMLLIGRKHRRVHPEATAAGLRLRF